MPQDVLAKSSEIKATGSDWLARKIAAQRATRIAEKPSIFEVERQRRAGIEVKEAEPEKVKPVPVPAPVSLAEAERQAQATAEWEAQHVKLDTEEWISKEEFNKLATEQQKYLQTQGIDKFNVEQNRLHQVAIKQWESQQESLQIPLQIKSYEQQMADNKIKIAEWEKIISTPGISESYKTHARMEVDSLKQTNLSLQESITTLSKQPTALDPDWQKIIDEKGTEGFSQYIKDNYPGALGLVRAPDPYSGQIKEYGTTDNPNIVIEQGGNRIYIGGKWPETASKYMTKMPEGIAALRWAEEVKTALIRPEAEPIETEVVKRWDKKVSSFLIPEAEVKLAATGETISQQVWKQLTKQEQAVAHNRGLEAIYEKLPDGGMILKRELEKLEPKYQEIIKEKGYDAYIEQVKRDSVLLSTGELVDKEMFQALPSKMQEAVQRNGLQAIDISKLSPEAQFSMMKSWELVDKDAKFGGVDKEGQILIKTEEAGETVKEPWYKKFLTKEFAKGAAVGMIPIAGTMYFWKTMKPWERGLSIALDVATLIPFVGVVSVGVRAGRGVAASVGRAVLAEVKAPIVAITRPVATVKGMIRPFKTLLSAKRVPTAAAEIRSYIIKIPDNVVRDIGDTKSAMQARDALTEAAIRGQKPVIEIGGKRIELAQVAIQQKMEAAAIHNMPDARAFLNGAVVKEGSEGLGLFVEPYLNTRLTQADAFGRGFTPSVDIGTFEWTGRHIRKIGKYAPQEVAKIDTAPIRRLNLADAEGIPADIAPALHNYIARERGTIVGSFTEWLKLDNAPRPHDVDLNFANPVKAREDIANIARRAGYQTQVKESAILIKDRQGKIVEVCNVKGARDAFFKQHGIEMIPARTIDGIQVIPLGEQYLRQGFGAIGAGEDIATYKKRTEHMFRTSKKLKNLIQDAGLTERMPGALVIRDEKILARMQPSDKLYRGTLEIEQTIKPLTELPPPSQIIQMYDATGETIHLLVVGKPFTPAQITKMKIVGAVDTIRDIFRPAMKIDGKAVKAMDEINELAVGARALRKRIELASKAGRTDEIAKLQAELGRINSRTRAIARNIDSTYAARTSLRPIAIATGDYIDRISYRDIATRKPQEFARVLRDMPEVDRVRVLNELDRPARARIEREIKRIPTPRVEIPREPILPRADIPRIEVPRVPRAEIPRVTRAIPERITERIPERVPERVPTRVTERIPERIPVTERARIPEIPRVPGVPKITTTTITKPGLSGFEELSKEQKLASIAWRQGKWFHLIYPPYSKTNVLHSTEPFPGVTVVTGVGSAKKSLSRVKGEVLPDKILWDLGIVDIEFTKGKEGKVGMKYIPDPHDKSKVRMPVGMPETRIKSRRSGKSTTSIVSTVR